MTSRFLGKESPVETLIRLVVGENGHDPDTEKILNKSLLRHRNCADRFREEHHGAYEDLERHSQKKFDPHYRGNPPALDNRLEKRKSTVNVDPIEKENHRDCKSLKFRSSRASMHSNGCRQPSESQKLSGVSKAKVRLQRHRFLLLHNGNVRVCISRGCQCAKHFAKTIGTICSMGKCNAQDASSPTKIPVQVLSQASIVTRSGPRRERKTSTTSSRNSSVSRYSSFGSMEQEPMVV